MNDHKAGSIETVIGAVKTFQATDPEALSRKDVHFHLAMGGIGIMAATNDVIAENEFPMLFWVYAAVIVLVLMAYRNWRAVVCCSPSCSSSTWSRRFSFSPLSQ